MSFLGLNMIMRKPDRAATAKKYNQGQILEEILQHAYLCIAQRTYLLNIMIILCDQRVTSYLLQRTFGAYRFENQNGRTMTSDSSRQFLS